MLPALFLLWAASGAQAQTNQLVCKVKWDERCIDALLIKRDCPRLLGAAAASGTLKLEGKRAQTSGLGIVTDYAVVQKSANEFAFEGEWRAPEQFMRGHGTFERASGRLRLYMTLGKHPGDDHILQRGLVADCK